MENRYDKYKDSGIAWIGEIPEHWEVKRVKNICSQTNIKENSKGNPLPYIGLENIESGSGKYVDTTSEVDGIANRFCKNNVLFGKLRPYLSKVYLAKSDGICSTEFIVYDTKENDCRFIHKLLLSQAFIEVVNSSTYGAKMPRANSDFINNIYVQIPPLSEQQSIATYLDQKCSEIDELITLQEEMITKLQSYKQSVITEAVTKGLDKNVPLKDSGIEWIGEIPEHWEVKRLKNVCSQINIKENSKENSLPYIGLENIESGSGRYIDTTSEVEGMANRFCKNNVLFGKLRPYLSKVYLAEKDGICSTEFIVYDTKSNNCRFIHKLLLSQAFIEVVNSSTYGAKMPRANSDFINNIYVQIPPLSEQQSIADYLDQKCSEIDELISIKQQKVEKLKDYKKSLIFECVTGKRKVS